MWRRILLPVAVWLLPVKLTPDHAALHRAVLQLYCPVPQDTKRVYRDEINLINEELQVLEHLERNRLLC